MSKAYKLLRRFWIPTAEIRLTLVALSEQEYAG
jgi:hypothetical protein